MGLRVCTADPVRPMSSARPSKMEPVADKPGGFQDWLTAISSSGRAPASDNAEKATSPSADTPSETAKPVQQAADSKPLRGAAADKPKQGKPSNSADQSLKKPVSDALGGSQTVKQACAPSGPPIDVSAITQTAQTKQTGTPTTKTVNNAAPVESTATTVAKPLDSNTNVVDCTPVAPEPTAAAPSTTTNSARATAVTTIPPPPAPLVPPISDSHADLDPTANVPPPKDDDDVSLTEQSHADAVPVVKPSQNPIVADVGKPLDINQSPRLVATPQAVVVRPNSVRTQPIREQDNASADRPTLAVDRAKLETSRRAEDGNQSGSGTTKQDRTASKSINPTPAGPSDRPGPSPSKIASLPEVKTITVRTASGDSAAVSVGRILVGEDLASSRTGSAAPASLAPPDTNQAATAPAPQGNNITPVVQQLLAGIDGAKPDDLAARVLSGSTAKDRHHATLQLDPPELGELRIAIHMDAHGMRLRVDAESAATAKLIESRLPELRDSLAASGIHVERTEVVLRSPETADATTPSHERQQPGSDSNPNAQQSSSGLNDGQRFHDPRHGASWTTPVDGAVAAEDEITLVTNREPTLVTTRSMNAASINLVA